MRECSSESAFLVNAEVDSMGGVIDSRVGIGIKTSPGQAEIEKAQEEIRLEIDCREERLRELEFLEKGGDPLDFRFTHDVSVSVQSTSLTDRLREQIVTSKVNESYASEALHSPHGETVESFGKPGGITCEGNSGDNLLLFDGENKVLKGKNSKGRAGKNTAAPEIATRIGGNHNAKGSKNSVVFRPYARRNRSKSRDSSRLVSADSHACNQGSTHFRAGTRDVKGSLSDANRKDQKLSTICKLKSSNKTGELAQKNDGFRDVEPVKIPAEDKLTDVAHGSLRKLALDVKTDGDLVGCEKGHDKYRDASSCCAGTEAEESSELANCGSLLCDGTAMTQQTGDANHSDVPALSKKSECPLSDRTMVNSDIQTPNSVRDSSAYLVNGGSTEHCKEPMLVGDEGRKPVTEDPFELKINSKPVDPSVVIDGESMHHDAKSKSVIKDPDLEYKSVTFGSLKTTESKESKELEIFRNAEIVDEHNARPRNGDTAEVRTCITSVLDEVSEIIPSGGATINKVVLDTACNKKLTDKMDEDSLLAEAKIILAKRRRIADISMRSLPLKNCQKSHWDFLLEEMAWLANDYMQERLWKITAAAQLGRHSALASQERDHKQIPVRRLKFVAHSMAKAVMEFWHASEMLISESCDSTNGISAHADQDGPDSLEPRNPRSCRSFALKSYALRFLRYNSSAVLSVKQEDLLTSNDMHDLAVQGKSEESCIAEDALFYEIPPGAMQCYRTSIESYVLQCEKNGSIQKEDDPLIHEADEVIMEMSQHNVYDEDEGETDTYCVPGTVEWSKASQFPHKKQKGNNRTYSSGSYKLGANWEYGSHMRGAQSSFVMVKRPATNNLVSIPTKRTRTASRQRVLGSSSGTGVVNMLALEKDASSEDTNSYQDEYGGSQLQRSLEVESPVDFDNYLPNDSEETSSKQKKKKTSKNMGDYSKRRWDGQHLDSNGCDGVFGQHKNKKLKLSKQILENVLDYGAPMLGSMPSPIPSQMSNLSKANEYKRMIANRDRLKKVKVTKLHIPIPGSGNAWTSFEDQALVVLVHDLGPNWDLVSDAINSTLRLKHIFREPKECKERHKLLMDQTAGDGADSAEDSGSSQPYPSTMPGIPKGSARQLFQRLHGPMEEDMVKSHFEKIIMIGQKHHHHRKQRGPHDQELLLPPHNSHVIAISQVSSNNMNGGFLTPHDLVDAIMSSPDALALGYQCPQTNSFTNQSCGPSVFPPGMPVGNNLSSPSGSLSHRNGRYGVTSLSTDDQQRVQQLNPSLSGRNIQQSTSPVAGLHPVADRFGPHKLQGGNGMAMVNGINNRGKPMSRPGFQGLGSSDVLSSGMGGMPSLEMQSVIGSSSGNSMLRHVDNSHQLRPGQKMVPELQMRVAQANSNPINTVNGLSGSYTGPTGSSPGQSFSLHPQQKPQKSLQQSRDITGPHPSHLRGAIGSQNPTYARLVKERQLQQQQQMFQQQQYYASNAMMPQAHPQLPVMQKSPAVQPQHSSVVSHSSQSPSASLRPIYSQPQQKHHLPPHGYSRDSQSGSSGTPNQMTKPRQRHPQQQSVRPHTAQELQQLHSQHGKQFKGEGNANLNSTFDQSNLNESNLNGKSLSTSPGDQSVENGEQAVQALGSQTSSECQLQQKLYSPVSHPPTQMLPIPPLSDNGNQGVPRQAISTHLVSSPNHPSFGNAAMRAQTCTELNDERNSPWQVTEPLQDSPLQNISGRLGSIVSPQTASPGNDSSLIAGPGSIRKQLSGGLTSSANNVGEKWQQKRSNSPQQE